MPAPERTPEGPLWQIENLAYEIAGRRILTSLTLSLEPGRIYGLIGPNGSGKSTLLKLMARQLAPAGGSIRFAGRPLGAWRDREFARQVAYMPQFTPPADGLNLRELVALGRFPWHGTLGRTSAADRAKVAEAITRTGLGAMAERSVDSLSGGERQRAWLALMLAQDPRCLLLDEPTSALDLAHQVEVLTLIRDLAHAGRADGMAVVAVLHDINSAARTCDGLIALRQGEIVAAGPVAEIMQPETLAAIYGIPMGVMPHPVRGDPLGYVL